MGKSFRTETPYILTFDKKMKTFVIFPTICVFLLTLTLLNVSGQRNQLRIFILTGLITIIFGGLMTLFSVDVFTFLYYSNFISVLIAIPCLTYLTNKMFPDISGKKFWFRVFGLGIASTVLTLLIFGTAMFFSFAYNPMDPAPRQEQNK